MERNSTPPTRISRFFLRRFLKKPKISALISDHFCVGDVVLKIIKDLGVFGDFLEPFGASNWRKLKGFAQNWISGTSKNPPKSLTIFRGAAWNPFFAEITKISNLRNKIAHALRNLILLKFQLSENKWLGKRRSGYQICGWNLSIQHKNDPDQKTTSRRQK